MTERTKSIIKTNLNADIPDNNLKLVSPADVRENVIDLVDSLQKIITTESETISTEKELEDGDSLIQVLTASGGNQNLKLMASLETSDTFVIVKNSGPSNNIIVVNSADSTVVTLELRS